MRPCACLARFSLRLLPFSVQLCAVCALCLASACVSSNVLFMRCRKHLKRDSANGGPPQDTEDLFRLLKQVANKFQAPVTNAPTAPARKSRRPGKKCCIWFIVS